VRTDVENMSDHHHLFFSYDSTRTSPSAPIAHPGCPTVSRRRPGWNTARMDADRLAVALMVAKWTGMAPPPEILSPVAYAESKAERLVRQATEACNVALQPRHSRSGGRPPATGGTGK